MVTGKGLFVTGTDTGVGKTQISAALVHHLVKAGYPIDVRKPAESACLKTRNGLTAQDALTLAQAAKSASTESICPYRFESAVSTARASELSGHSLLLGMLQHACHSEHFVIVEGAGGWYSPIAKDGLNADLAGLLRWPVLLVAADRLGCINHILLCLETMRQRKLTCVAVVLNQTQAQQPSAMDNAQELRAYCRLPVISIPYCQAAPAWQHLDIQSLAGLIENKRP